jgi:hypothetical protein
MPDILFKNVPEKDLGLAVRVVKEALKKDPRPGFWMSVTFENDANFVAYRYDTPNGKLIIQCYQESWG